MVLYLEKMLISDHNALLFCRPMQLGKTTLLSLVEELFSVNRCSSVDPDLNYSPGEQDRIKWFILHLDFGNVNVKSESGEERWGDIGRRIDEATLLSIILSIKMEIKAKLLFYVFSLRKEIHTSTSFLLIWLHLNKRSCIA